MTKFFCTHCKYKFEAKEQSATCPYCNEGTVEPEKSASDIVDEVSSMLEE